MTVSSPSAATSTWARSVNWRRCSSRLEGTIVLDLEEVTFLDSSGLQGMVAAHQAARERGDDLILRRPSPPVCRVLEMTDLNGVFVIET